MKTIVFALQVFGLMALLPICMTLEMNYATKSQTAATVTKVAIAANSTNSSLELSNSIAKYPVAAIAFSKVLSNTKKKCSNKYCICRDCKCGSTCTCHDF